ncbi:MAG: hypothetical protein ACJ8F3_19265 [Xanthobacteraceae bacterium]
MATPSDMRLAGYRLSVGCVSAANTSILWNALLAASAHVTQTGLAE